MSSVGAGWLNPSYPYRTVTLKLHLYSCFALEQEGICEANSLPAPPQHALISVTKPVWSSSISLLSMRLFETKKVCSREFPLTPQFQTTAVPFFLRKSALFCFVLGFFFGGVGAFLLFGFFFSRPLHQCIMPKWMAKTSTLSNSSQHKVVTPVAETAF